MKIRTLVLVLAAALLAGLSIAPATLAQNGAQIQSDQAHNNFPKSIDFTLVFTAPSPPDEVRLLYSVAPDGTAASAEPTCTGDAIQTCKVEFFNRQKITLIPGLEITYHWRVTSGGEQTETEERIFTYEDTRFKWRSLTDGGVTVRWYASGDDSIAPSVAATAHQTLDDIGALLKTKVEFPVKVILYHSAADMSEAIADDRGAGVATAGEVVYSDTAMVSAEWVVQDVTRHEVAHIVIREATKGPFTFPDWLNEGLAVYAQSKPTSGQRAALDAAIASDKVFPLQRLGSASVSSSAENVNLFYGQSWSVVNYLIETYGRDKFARLFSVFKDGSTPDKAFKTVYGFDLAGLENEWRQSVGLPAREPAPTSTANPSATPSPSAQTDGGGSSVPIAAIAGIVGGAALLVVVGGALLLTRRKG